MMSLGHMLQDLRPHFFSIGFVLESRLTTFPVTARMGSILLGGLELTRGLLGISLVT